MKIHPELVALLFASVILGLVTRAAMKRFVARELGAARGELLELDLWRASKGRLLARLLIFVELLSWAGTIVLVVLLAPSALQ